MPTENSKLCSFAKDIPGVKSPRKVEDVDLAVLRKAVLDGYNERHGEEVTDFQTLLV